ncbi:MAG: CHASE2 domain-containing protein, partial [Cyanobacteria bacterium J06632_3]
MPPESRAPSKTVPKASKAATTVTLTHTHAVSQYWQRYRPRTWRQVLRWACFGCAVMATALNPAAVQRLERQVQTTYWEFRGPVTPPSDIVILAIDDESLSQGQHYLDAPEQYPELAGISAWPWQRQVYAEVMAKLFESGARAVAIDLVFSTPSAYGLDDDQALAETLQQYGDRVVLATKLGDLNLRQGDLLQPTLPLPALQATSVHLGVINFGLEPNGQIHQLSDRYLALVEQVEQELTGIPVPAADRLPSFAEATLQAADVDVVAHRGDHIFFYGPARTFDQVPFW